MHHLLDINYLPSDINCLLYGNTPLTDDNDVKIFEIVQKIILKKRGDSQLIIVDRYYYFDDSSLLNYSKHFSRL